MKGPLEPAVKRRWLEAKRQYSPWHYADAAMVVVRTGEQMTLPAEIKEQCHHFHSAITRLQNISPRDRHRMLGNSWHIGVVKFLLWLVLAQITPSSSASASAVDPAFDGLLSRVLHDARLEPVPLSREPPASKFIALPPSDNEWEHWLMTAWGLR